MYDWEESMVSVPHDMQPSRLDLRLSQRVRKTGSYKQTLKEQLLLNTL